MALHLARWMPAACTSLYKVALASRSVLPALAGSVLSQHHVPGASQSRQTQFLQIQSLVDTKARLIDKLLIANRGEIACRIIRTARRLGIRTVAVYSEPDKHALHVRQADEAVCVGPAAALQSYLNMDAIIDAASKTGARAVHPGYGFLSENADFVERLTSEGIIFVGPPASAIRSLGDKVESKRIAKAAGLNMIPGWVGAVEDEAHAVRIASDIGYPVMIKASAGGGGKGMRVAWNEAEVKEMVPMAKAEALASFGDDTLLLEKYIQGARHIEFQVLGDHFGHMVYLPERDCSVQRRNQKVLEESPSPTLTPAVRAAMGEQAVALALAVGYNSTGTVEFVVDDTQSFYFLEMNTRLQVEHPVTEAVSGLDLVDAMIRIAGNQRLDLSQERAAQVNGWAMEARVYAEDPSRNFMPSPGLIKVYREPVGPGIRVDTGVEEGSEISLHYDPMIAKVIGSGPTRDAALRTLCTALDGYVVRGTEATNLPHLRACLGMPSFVSGNYNTSFIPEKFKGPHALEALAFPLAPEHEQELLAAAVYLHAARALRFNPRLMAHKDKADLAISMRDVHAGRDHHMPVVVRRAEVQMVGQAGVAAGALEVQLPHRVAYVQAASNQQPGPLARSRYTPYLHELIIDGKHVLIQIAKYIPRGMIIQHMGAQRAVYVETPAAAAMSRYMPSPQTQASQRVVTSPMTGTLVQLCVEKGSEVRIGDDLLVIEAMKMRNAIKAQREGFVQELMVKEGQLVTTNMPLLKLW